MNSVKRKLQQRRAIVGAGGLKMLLLSLLLTLLSGGVSLLLTLVWTLRQADKLPHRLSSEEQTGVLLIAGKRLVDGLPDSDFQARLQRGLACWSERPVEILILGGYTGAVGEPSEAEAGAGWLRDRGVDAAMLVLEQRSRHTLENLQFARDLIGTERQWYIVSNRYHLPRLGLMAQGMGLSLRLLAAEERLSIRLRDCGRWLLEAFYNQWYWVGRRWALFVGDQGSLQRLG